MRTRTIDLVALAALLLAGTLAACTSEPKTVVVEEEFLDEEEVIAEDIEGVDEATSVQLPPVISPRSFTLGRIVLEGFFGDAPGDFGGSGEPDAVSDGTGDPGDVVGPQSLAAGPGGSVYILDGIKSRIVRLAGDGTIEREFPLQGPVYSGDLAVTGDGRMYVLEISPETRLHELATDGTLVSTTAVTDPYDVPVALAAGRDGLPYVWMSEGDVRLYLSPEVGGTGEPESFPGLPVGEDVFANPVLVDDDLAAVRMFDPEGFLVTETMLRSPPGLVIGQISDVAITDAGRVLVVLDRFTEDEMTGETTAAEHLVVGIDPEAGLIGSASLPPNEGRSGYRSVALGADGSIWQLHLSADRMSLVRWELQ